MVTILYVDFHFRVEMLYLMATWGIALIAFR